MDSLSSRPSSPAPPGRLHGALLRGACAAARPEAPARGAGMHHLLAPRRADGTRLGGLRARGRSARPGPPRPRGVPARAALRAARGTRRRSPRPPSRDGLRPRADRACRRRHVPRHGHRRWERLAALPARRLDRHRAVLLLARLRPHARGERGCRGAPARDGPERVDLGVRSDRQARWPRGCCTSSGAPCRSASRPRRRGLGAISVLLVPRAVGHAHLSGERHAPTLTEALAGVRFILATRALLGTMSLDLVAVLLGGATSLLPVFSQDVLHVGALGNGLLRAAPSAGAVVVALILTAHPLKRRVGPTLFLAVAAFGALHARLRALAQLRPLARRARLPGGVRHAQHVHPLDARAAAHATGAARPGRRGGARLHRWIERARRLRVGRRGRAHRRSSRRRDRRRARDVRRRDLGVAVPAAPPIDRFEDALP